MEQVGATSAQLELPIPPAVTAPLPDATPARAQQPVTLERLQELQAEFAKGCDWDQFHSPRNLLLALVGEVGELSELFQWRGEVPRGLPGWSAPEREHLGEELSDVLLYLVRLADVSGVDLGRAVLRKLDKNALKYPAAACRGSSQKYTAYQVAGEKEAPTT